MIHMADRNADSLERQVGRSREEFLEDGFHMILRAIAQG